ncbi:Butirosin biosynthesis, BtrG-like protein [Polychytrium aggregatum]|uniref:Butirosin biosynthesis, BtrG-like protein n=1 Tax=Polychytrium aggregatum TaxID=110093 RepID=UPI0022FE8BD0|nr:Butirosin biosynthesis, BtrG-like protein [Polychytrium aggregatum]KAI9207013.1 Butirosin biosynthesis, BtrG-like protein [Polychytrium aggregatum]
MLPGRIGSRITAAPLKDPSTPRPVFCYGTLMSPEIWGNTMTQFGSGLDARLPDGVPAQLMDFRRHRIIGAQYPGIIPAKGHSVRGRLTYVGNHEHVKVLDFFEGADYERTTVAVVILDGPNTGTQVEADVYVWIGGLECIGPGDWDADKFLRSQASKFTQY